MLNRYDFASSRFGISRPNTSRNDKNIPYSPNFHLSWQFCRTINVSMNTEIATDKIYIQNEMEKNNFSSNLDDFQISDPNGHQALCATYSLCQQSQNAI